MDLAVSFMKQNECLNTHIIDINKTCYFGNTSGFLAV